MRRLSSRRPFLLLPGWAVKPDFRRFFRLPPSQRPFYPRPAPPQGGRYQLNRLRCSRLPEKLMKTSAPPAPEAPKAPRTHKQRPAHWCHRCPFCGPGGQCLDRRLKSGRCGDWVWYLRDGRQLRRLYVKPQDPLSPAQRDCRAQFGAASARYSHSLTEKQRCLYRGGSEGAKSAPPRPVRSAHRTAVFDSARLRGEGGTNGAGVKKHEWSPANKGDFAILLGYTPEYHRTAPGALPADLQASREAERQ